MLQESILPYFRPSLNYHLSLRPLFCLFFEWPLKSKVVVIVLVVDAASTVGNTAPGVVVVFVVVVVLLLF